MYGKKQVPFKNISFSTQHYIKKNDIYSTSISNPRQVVTVNNSYAHLKLTPEHTPTSTTLDFRDFHTYPLSS